MGSGSRDEQEAGGKGRLSTAYIRAHNRFCLGLLSSGYRREMMPAASPSRPRSGMVPVPNLYPASNAGRRGDQISVGTMCKEHTLPTQSVSPIWEEEVNGERNLNFSKVSICVLKT